VKLPPISAQQAHYLLAAVLTVECGVRFWLDKKIDAATGAFLIGFWTTAVANDKYNTPTPA